jgi:hypothetical protein
VSRLQRQRDPAVLALRKRAVDDNVLVSNACVGTRVELVLTQNDSMRSASDEHTSSAQTTMRMSSALLTGANIARNDLVVRSDFVHGVTMTVLCAQVVGVRVARVAADFDARVSTARQRINGAELFREQVCVCVCVCLCGIGDRDHACVAVAIATGDWQGRVRVSVARAVAWPRGSCQTGDYRVCWSVCRVCRVLSHLARVSSSQAREDKSSSEDAQALVAEVRACCTRLRYRACDDVLCTVE